MNVTESDRQITNAVIEEDAKTDSEDIRKEDESNV